MMKDSKLRIFSFAFLFCILLCAILIQVMAQEMPPAPGAPKSINLPAVKEAALSNKLKVVTVERKNVPLVTVQLLIRSGAQNEAATKAGLADMTASLLTKGTATRTAEQIAEQIEFLGGSISTGAGWNNSVVVVSVMSDKLDQALAIMSDAVRNPSFKQEEIDLLKSQTQDGLAYNLKQPGFLASYVASKYSFSEHPAGGTPDSINSITRDDILNFYKNNYTPEISVLIFTGDIAPVKAESLAQKYFGGWSAVRAKGQGNTIRLGESPVNGAGANIARRILVVDLPNSGQAAVAYTRNLSKISRANQASYFPATVLNSVLGGGYSSRLNQEIRIKRGLSYGAGSGFSWRGDYTNFATRTQTKNESAAEVAQLVLEEVKKLENGVVPATELGPRKLVLTGDFGRNLETTGGLAGAISELYSFGIPATYLNNYMSSIEKVSDQEIQKFAGANLSGGDIIIVGDYVKFKDDLAKRFPGMQIVVVPAANLDITKENLLKSE